MGRELLDRVEGSVYDISTYDRGFIVRQDPRDGVVHVRGSRRLHAVGE